MTEAERRFLQSGGDDPWFDATPERRARRDALARLWADLDQIPDLAHLAPPPHRSRRGVLIGGGALALAAGMGGIALLPRADLAAPRGQMRESLLPDGSHLLLDAGSRADLQFGGDARVLRLLQGRADLRILPAARHFVVLAPPGRVIAETGHVTVHLWDDAMTVACHAGAVHVTLLTGHDLPLAAGSQITLGPSGHDAPEPLSAAEREWQAGRLVFEDRPLRQVVADIGRYRSGRIVLRGTALRDLRVTGVFDAARPEAALDAIAAALPLRRHDLGPITFLTPA